MTKRVEQKYIVGNWIDNEEGALPTANEDPLRPFTSTFLHHIDQGALGAYTGVTYINNNANYHNGSQ